MENFDPSMHGWFLWTKHIIRLCSFIGSRDCSGFACFPKFLKCLTSSLAAKLSVPWGPAVFPWSIVSILAAVLRHIPLPAHVSLFQEFSLSDLPPRGFRCTLCCVGVVWRSILLCFGYSVFSQYLACSGMWCWEPIEEARQLLHTARTGAFSILAHARSGILPATSGLY